MVFFIILGSNCMKKNDDILMNIKTDLIFFWKELLHQKTDRDIQLGPHIIDSPTLKSMDNLYEKSKFEQFSC